MGVIDKASHAYGGRKTARTETMYLRGGFAYVYRIYGIYFCMNITANLEGNAEAVLIRGVFPNGGFDEMYENLRKHSRRKCMPESAAALSEAGRYSFTNGPGKLCIAMQIGADNNRNDMLSESFYVRDDGYAAEEILTASRIGIDYAEEAALYPWRFFAKENKGVPVFLKK